MHLIVICGPTAGGKTALAVEAAHALGTDVVSADSRQVYRRLDIGTGKDLDAYRSVSPHVRHHLIDIADPAEIYSLYRYQEDFYRLLEALAARGVPRLVVCGGTGLYLEAVLRRYRIANIPGDEVLRRELSGREHGELAEELRRVDPALFARTDVSSKKRIVRALEIHRVAREGRVSYSRAPAIDFTFGVFCLCPPRSLLRQRIDERLRRRLRDGMIDEVKGLIHGGLSRQRLDLLGMEYREIAAYLAGEKSAGQMELDLGKEIRLLAKRQETYFRGMERRGMAMRRMEIPDGAGLLRQIREQGHG